MGFMKVQQLVPIMHLNQKIFIGTLMVGADQSIFFQGQHYIFGVLIVQE